MEVVRVGGGLEDNMAGGDDSDNNQDAEIHDRKLVCMVRQESSSEREVQQIISVIQTVV